MSSYVVNAERTVRFVQKSMKGFLNKRVLSLGLLSGFAVAAPVFAQMDMPMDEMNHSGPNATPPSPPLLVRAVRAATIQYRDPTIAKAAGYGPALGCVSGPDHGAMGVHYINGSLLNGEIKVTKPQAIIYEPLGGSKMRMVGVEYIVDQATWLQKQKDAGVDNPGPPSLYGQLFQLVGSPNRYNLPTFYELHVWAWQDNPNGTFVDWNNMVSCDHQEKTLQ